MLNHLIELVYKILQKGILNNRSSYNIGSMLGFETEREYKISQGAQVDAIWSAKISNLGTFKYVFEVQKSGSRKSLLLNLLKAKNNPNVQKLIVISDDKQLLQIEKECEGYNQNLGEILRFWKLKMYKKLLKI